MLNCNDTLCLPYKLKSILATDDRLQHVRHVKN